MHKLLISLVVATALATSSVAMAAAPMAPAKAAAPATMTANGKVVAVSTKYCTVSLANLGVYVFGKGCKLSKITVGEWVTITWSKSGNWRKATKIVAAKPMGMAGMMMMMPMMGMKH
jgi:hypothetical protein